MLNLFRRRRLPSRISYRLWQRVANRILARFGLSPTERVRLRSLASRFLDRKTINGAGGFVVTDEIRVAIAAQACLLILYLGIEYFDGWVEVIVYPDTFVTSRDVREDTGLVHTRETALGGEAWLRGPVILAWRDVAVGMLRSGTNVVLHEFAHKIDMLNGVANGMPPLHADMASEQWSQTLSASYENLSRAVANRVWTDIDPYAAENPAEFFAVMSETFFERPEILYRYDAALYQQLSQFYRQDPRTRRESFSWFG
ncbi:MAG: zinc-dependent peptidase [Gammaproteobacteria bacterium]|nr:zinc-dependent peptidase [Gammaproteobacteria bacterium]